MRVLLVKMSSMGDVIHALPAVTDAASQVPAIVFDWVVEQGFSDIPAWHPAVDRVLPVATRRWRRSPWRTRTERRQARRDIADRTYDLVLDAQGLMKSAAIARYGRSGIAGFDRQSVREPLASLVYGHRIQVARDMHAIDRQRRLFAGALGYDFPGGEPDYGLEGRSYPVPGGLPAGRYVVLLHGTSWPSKRWPLEHWQSVGRVARASGFEVVLLSADDAEQELARSVAAILDRASVFHGLTLSEVAGVLAGATGAIAVDTGLGHMAAALGLPSVSIYGSTRPGLTGTTGRNQLHIEADIDCSPCLDRQCRRLVGGIKEPPCYSLMSPEAVWSKLQSVMGPGAPSPVAGE